MALASAVIFSLMLSYMSYTPVSKREPNTWYDPFSSFMQVYLIFSLPTYLLGGVPVSLYVDKYVKKGTFKLILYLLAGFLIGVAIIVISFMTIVIDVLWYGVIGLFASLLFFTLMLLTKGFK